MATRKPDDPKRDDRLPGEHDLSGIYHGGDRDLPPPALDAHILAAAQGEVSRSAPTRHVRWALPLSTAAVVVLAVGVVLLMTKQGTLNHRSALEVPNEYNAVTASPPVVDTVRNEEPVAAAKAKRAAPAAEQLAESVAPSSAAPVVAVQKVETPQAPGTTQEADRARTRSTAAGVVAMKTQGADVTAVQVSGSPGRYDFNVTVKSPDTGCQQYADWWEVVSEEGRLLYRRVLFHSHVGEQPFTRSGGPVPIQPDTVVWVRAHMNTSGYGGALLKGSVRGGFTAAVPPAGFAAGLAKQSPLPDGCAF
jgi:hypothetical protein